MITLANATLLKDYSSVSLCEEYVYRKACDDFYTFRRLINPKAKVGWFYRELTDALQKFYEAFKRKEKPELIIQAPPQHGKSEAITDFIAWIFGKEKDVRVIYASFSENLGVRANLKIQRIASSKMYQNIFEQVLNTSNVVTVSSQKLRNKNILENIQGGGYFRNTTCGGSITGETLDLGIIDDPIKGREAAESLTMREKNRDWYLNDFLTRFDENAAFLMILTRWHDEDLAGLIQKTSPSVKVLSYKAIAEDDEPNRKTGEALFPEFKSLDFLNKRKIRLGTRDFESLYQQKPIVEGGNLFNIEWFKFTPHRIDLNAFERVFITADTAQKTKELNDFTVYSAFGVLEHKLYMLDMFRGKVQSLSREAAARAIYKKFVSAKRFEGFYIEQKASGIDLYQRMKEGDKDKGYKPLLVREVERETDKVSRCLNILPYAELYNLYVYDDLPQQADLLAEAAQFPVATHDDIMDTIFDAFDIAFREINLDYTDVYNSWYGAN